MSLLNFVETFDSSVSFNNLQKVRQLRYLLILDSKLRAFDSQTFRGITIRKVHLRLVDEFSNNNKIKTKKKSKR